MINQPLPFMEAFFEDYQRFGQGIVKFGYAATNFMSTWYNLETSEQREPQLRKCLHMIWLEGILLSSGGVGPAHCGQHHPWDEGLVFCKEAGWTCHEEQSSKQNSSMASVSALATRSLLCMSSCLTPFNDRLMCKYEKSKPFPTNLLFCYDVSS